MDPHSRQTLQNSGEIKKSPLEEFVALFEAITTAYETFVPQYCRYHIMLYNKVYQFEMKYHSIEKVGREVQVSTLVRKK